MSRRPSHLTRRTMNGLLWASSGAGAQALLSLVVLVTLARLLSPADFGVVGAALVVINFSRLFSELGLGPALVQRRDLERQHLETAFTTSVLSGLLCGGTIWLAAPAIAHLIRMERLVPVLRALAWLFPLLGLGLVSESLLNRELQFKWLTKREVITYALSYGGVGIALAFLGAGVWALVAAQLAQSVFNVTFLLIKRPLPPRLGWDRRAFRELLHFGGGHSLGKLGNFVAQQGDNFVVGRWLGAEALGLYSRSYQLMATSSSLLGGVLDKVLFPVMARVQDDKRLLAGVYTRGLALIALLVLPASALLFVLGPEVIRVMLGPKWSRAVVPFQIFAAGMFLRTTSGLSDSISRATGLIYQRAWRQGCYALLVLLGAWIGQFWGINMVAAGVLVAMAVNFMLMAQLGMKATGTTWRPLSKACAPAGLLAAAVLPIAWAAARAVRGAALAPAAVVGASVGLTGVGVILLLWLAPRVFLGREGARMLELLHTYLPGRWSARTGAAAAARARSPTAEAAAYHDMNPGRAAFFLPSLDGGGAERVMIHIARGFAERGVAVDLVLAQAKGPYLAQVPAAARIVDLRARRVLTSLPALIRYLRSERPQVLVSISSHGNIVALWARTAAHVPTRAFVTVHNIVSEAAQHPFATRARVLPYLQRLCYPWADGIVAVSTGVAQDISHTTGIPLDRIHVVSNPVVTPELLERAREAPGHPWFGPGACPVILGVGRLSWEKDFATLVRAYALVRAQRAARLVILGEGPERPHLEALVRKLDGPADVDLPGFVPNPYAFMAHCAVFALSSATEGLPTALIEALAAGAPVVATDCRSGPREILQDGRFGRLVPVGNVAALAQAILATMAQPQAAAPATAWQSFTLDTAVSNYLRVLQVNGHA